MDDIQFTPHFKLSEFVSSATATKQGIENNPSPEAVENMRLLSVHTLEPLREALGMPVIITSGYRCKALNDIISHHSNRSQHLKGQAADFYVGWCSSLGGRGQSTGKCPNSRERLIQAFRIIITDDGIDFDQLILYPNFIHVSYASPNDNRHYIMAAQGNGKYNRLSREQALKIN